MANDIIPLELKKLGLKDKEIKVYLASLELGPASVQHIAQKAEVVRPTTYEIIKSLRTKGLFVETARGKKRLFVAQSPENILRLLRMQRRELEEKEREFIRIIAALETKYYSGERGGVSVFHGEEGIKMLQEKISFAATPEILVLASRTDKSEVLRRQEIYKQIKKRLGKIDVKELSPEQIGAQFVPGTLFVFDQAVFFPAGNLKGYLIENQLVVELFKSLFRALWKQVRGPKTS